MTKQHGRSPKGERVSPWMAMAAFTLMTFLAFRVGKEARPILVPSSDSSSSFVNANPAADAFEDEVENTEQSQLERMIQEATRTRQMIHVVPSSVENMSDPACENPDVEETCSVGNSSPVLSFVMEVFSFAGQGFGPEHKDDDEEDDDEEDDDEDDDEEDDDEEDDDDGVNRDACAAYLYTHRFAVQFIQPDFLNDVDRLRELVLEFSWEASKLHKGYLIELRCQYRAPKEGALNDPRPTPPTNKKKTASYSSPMIPRITCMATSTGGNGLYLQTYPDEELLVAHMVMPGIADGLSATKLFNSIFGNRSLSTRPDIPPRLAFSLNRQGSYDEGAANLADVEHRWDRLNQDLGDNFVSDDTRIALKELVAIDRSDFQLMEVWDMLHTRTRSLEHYEESLWKGAGTFRSEHPEFFKPDRILFLDGVLQSTEQGDEGYHEALVHPGMFTHPNPERVAIIGGGEGATLREILKHKTVTHCKMIEIDAVIVEFARKHLPFQNDCSSFTKGQNCFDDPRTEMRFEDAFAFFLGHFSKSAPTPAKEDLFDVIIVDALDPEDPLEFTVKLYRDDEFWGSLYDALTEDGVLAMQVGMSPGIIDVAEQYSVNANRAEAFHTIERVGFQELHVYEEPHCRMFRPWSFLLACKSKKYCSQNWFADPSVLQTAMHDRLLPTHGGGLSVRHFDATTMSFYQRPPRSWETLYCRADPRPDDCDMIKQLKLNTTHTMWKDYLKFRDIGQLTKLASAEQSIPKPFRSHRFDLIPTEFMSNRPCEELALNATAWSNTCYSPIRDRYHTFSDLVFET